MPASHRKRSLVVDEYDGKLAKARQRAQVVGALQSFCRFLAYCNLTWATVVLLGGFVSSLDSADFNFVIPLLLLEAGRLASAIFFSRLVIRKSLVKLSQNPSHLKLEDDQPTRARALRVMSPIGQALFILPSIVLPSIRLRVVQYDEHNLLVSLKIFYILALINAAVGLAGVVCSIWFLIDLFDKKEQSFQRYYDEILQRIFDYGIVQADEFGFFDFAFNVLGEEFARNVQAPTVQKHYKELVHYIYAHRQGPTFLEIYLDCENAFVQEAAANMVGFWIVQKLRVNKLPKSLLTKLADKLGPGQVGWAAANSFNALAKHHPHVVLESMRSDKTTVLATVIELVDTSDTGTLAFIKVLLTLVSMSNDQNIESPFSRIEETTLLKLVVNLETEFRGDKSHRLRGLAGYLLMLMEKLDVEAEKSIIEAIDPSEEKYIYKLELDMLNKLRERAHLQRLEKDTLIRKAQGKGTKNFLVREDL